MLQFSLMPMDQMPTEKSSKIYWGTEGGCVGSLLNSDHLLTTNDIETAYLHKYGSFKTKNNFTLFQYISHTLIRLIEHGFVRLGRPARWLTVDDEFHRLTFVPTYESPASFIINSQSCATHYGSSIRHLLAKDHPRSLDDIVRLHNYYYAKRSFKNDSNQDMKIAAALFRLIDAGWAQCLLRKEQTIPLF